jgi:hypothetical protein
MTKRIKELKEAFRNAKSDKEIEAISAEMNKLIAEDPDMFSESMVECIKETSQEATQLASLSC